MTPVRWLMIVGCLCLCTVQAQADPTFQDFDSPGTPFTLTQFGSMPAQIHPLGPTGNFLRLANAGIGGMLNTVAFDRTQVGTALPRVVADFDYRIGGSTNKADGMAFALLNTAPYGTSGAGPAISEEPNLTQSFGLGMDIFNNGPPADPDDNHLSLHFDNQWLASFPLGPFGYNLHSNTLPAAFDHMHIEIDPESGGSFVTVTITPASRSPFMPIDHFFIAGFAPYEYRVAFGARTGGANDNHDIDNIFVQSGQPIPDPSSLTLAGLGLLGLLGYSWRQRQRAA